jgi:hypothetical protein
LLQGFEDIKKWVSKINLSPKIKNNSENNIYSEEELDKESTCQNFRQVRKEGNRNVIIRGSISFFSLFTFKN